VKPLVESSRSKMIHKCSKSIFEKPLAKRCDDLMKVDLKEFKKSSKSKLVKNPSRNPNKK
jgi:hypothetical protein